jgi:hypothetical protein
VRGIERELDRLFGLPLAEFTSARNELARQLKSAGDLDGAAQVRALVKPSMPVWVINQLSRRESSGVRELLNAGDALRKSQERLLRAAGTPDSLRAAAAKEREAIALLMQHARAVLEDGGRSATPAMLDRIARTLQAAAVDEEGRRLLKAGRLTGELTPGGFEAFSGLQPSAGEESPSANDELAERRRQREERQRRERELQQKVRELERAARDAERDADRAADAASDARRAAEQARAAADKAAAELAEPQ